MCKLKLLIYLLSLHLISSQVELYAQEKIKSDTFQLKEVQIKDNQEINNNYKTEKIELKENILQPLSTLSELLNIQSTVFIKNSWKY